MSRQQQVLLGPREALEVVVGMEQSTMCVLPSNVRESQKHYCLSVEDVSAHPSPLSASIRSRIVTLRPLRAVSASAIRTSVSSRTEMSCGRDQILSMVVALTSATLPSFVRFTRGSCSATSRTRKRTILSPFPLLRLIVPGRGILTQAFYTMYILECIL